MTRARLYLQKFDELFIKRRRRERLGGRFHFRKSQIGKRSWRTNTLRHRWAISKWHRSIAGKASHRKLTRFLLTRNVGKTFEDTKLYTRDNMSRGAEILQLAEKVLNEECGTCENVENIASFLNIDSDFAAWLLYGSELPPTRSIEDATSTINQALVDAEAPVTNIDSEDFDFDVFASWLESKGVIELDDESSDYSDDPDEDY